ncbi:MAG: nitrile hydratase subunit beta [Haloferacaceae archaeon]
MNGIHDMGGMHGFGAVPDDGAAFHADWERTILGIDRVLKAEGVYNGDEKRYAIERMDPGAYLDGYFGRWVAAVETLLAEKGHVDPGEVDRRAAALAAGGADGAARAPDAVSLSEGVDADAVAARALDAFRAPADAERERAEPRFDPGDRVRTANRHPAGHTRCPRYVRDKVGTVEAHHGTHVYPDDSAEGVETARPLYNVRFDAAELWDGDTDAGAVHVDLWEPYLRPVE